MAGARSIIGRAGRCCTGNDRRATNYLDLGKKLFSLLRYRAKPVPTTMAATAGMLAATCRARIARARSRVRTPSASHAGVSRRPHALLA
ncbi:hypothetical protein Bamb_4609 [Burkholderia ambifaria AMMD]|uniref:Uncharacterized protein n=1 Tax=Burkholderia ambifaria (strain ATCC BAA-244 / DSM 16087 / CCUG 44356 / LMG 19182 / AMMD) TaxID=339670 RepID=Q0B6R4_BURCM|nr:hypothetical protein Bamb_4609 [Burkholderia ambifaria AMMD]